MTKTTKIRWVIAHEPAYLFYRVAEDFKRLVNQHKDIVNIDIEILTNSEYNSKYAPTEPANRNNLWKLLEDNSVQITQMTVSSLSRQFNRQMQVLDMPYLFDDHVHAAEVLEGPVGEYLLNNFDKSSKLKGLAYTYSGGFRLMPFNRSVSSLAELAGVSVRSGMSPIAQDTMRSFGFNPVPTEIEEAGSAVLSGQAVGAEHVAQRLLPDQCDQWIDTIVETEHSLFLTSIVVNLDWWNSLDQKVQEIFLQCAFLSARNERKLSIQDGTESLKKLENNGVKVVKLDSDTRAELQRRTEQVYEKYGKDYFESGLIEKIRKH
jgi:TRAP-type C4-dicarboxylate transport system substrate-binding protein